MPQMSPLWWVLLSMFFILSIYLMLCLIYYVSSFFVFKRFSFKLNHFFWSW
uniref:ATP synthase F0 subunit 8 n=1 Tax=Tituria sagittata TaxID=2777317 RepID=A0A7L8XGH2_9HEMI|nr:ATP synthase F0 subunit 8 [Tituria sagittata]QOH91225.1 ATP synthase F0 subunit 8 [Tituria sagittata]